MRILVIGAGWYGCHIAKTLCDAGHEVVVADAADEPLAGASGRNQFRLHMGFHYPRSFLTRQQTLSGYHQFIEVYSQLTATVERNLYAVDAQHSLIDFGTFCQVMDASGIPYEPADTDAAGLLHVEGAVQCDERVLLTEPARNYFQAELADQLQLGRRIESVKSADAFVEADGERFDYLVNCTWSTFRPPSNHDGHWYEPALLFYYKTVRQDLAITIMDGPFCSLYPCGGELATLSSVPFTPLGRFQSVDEGMQRLSKITVAETETLRASMEEQMRYYYPAFENDWEYDGVQLSLKTKLPSGTDMRACSVHRCGREISVFAGKIDAIFLAADEVLAMIDEADE